jgi:peptide/nickel transport system permease protein
MTSGATDDSSPLDPRPQPRRPPTPAPRTRDDDAVAGRGSLVRFLLVRSLLLVALTLTAASLMMLITSLAPGDATSELHGPGVSSANISAERARLDLDRPLAERYARWLGRVLRLDLGESSRYQQPVTGLVLRRAANTATLAIVALAAAALVGLPLGALAGCGRWPWLSTLVGAWSILALSSPPLLTSLVLALIAARTGWLPAGGMAGMDADTLSFVDGVVDRLQHLALPAAALALPLAATLERLQAAAVAEGRLDRHVLAARGLGLPFSRVLVRDLWRPTAAPVVGLLGLAAGSLLSGSLAVEIVTAWPGLGRLMFEALGARDAALAAGCAAMAAAGLAAWSALSDLLTWLVDPRLRPEAGR